MTYEKFTDQHYLVSEQYQDSRNLGARISLHERFSTNPYGWHRWVFDHLLQLPVACRLLELGCGSGTLWVKNSKRLPQGWQVTLTDLSAGMLADAQHTLASISDRFAFHVADAQALPFPDNSFDCVIANHMLYHVPDIEKALAEIRRVLSPSGALFAATNGNNHLKELRRTVSEVIPDIHITNDAVARFGLENGEVLLRQSFDRVELCRYEDTLLVNAAEPLLEFTFSMAGAGPKLPDESKARLKAIIESQLAAIGAIHITKDTGVFIARRSLPEV